MSKPQKSTDLSQIGQILSELLDGMVVAAFEDAAGSRMRFEYQKSNYTKNHTVPGVVTLDLKGNWWIGEHKE